MVLIRVPTRTTGGAAGVGLPFVTKSVDETINNDAVLHDDLELLFPAQANREYGVLVYYVVDTEAVPDWKYAISIPAGAIAEKFDGTYSSRVAVASSNWVPALNIPMGAGPSTILVMGRVLMGGTAGNINMQWAQNVSDAADTTVLRGSIMFFGESL